MLGRYEAVCRGTNTNTLVPVQLQPPTDILRAGWCGLRVERAPGRFKFNASLGDAVRSCAFVTWQARRGGAWTTPP